MATCKKVRVRGGYRCRCGGKMAKKSRCGLYPMRPKALRRRVKPKICKTKPIRRSGRCGCKTKTGAKRFLKSYWCSK